MSSVAVRMLRDSLEMRLRSVEIRRGPVIRHHSLLPSKTSLIALLMRTPTDERLSRAE